MIFESSWAKGGVFPLGFVNYLSSYHNKVCNFKELYRAELYGKSDQAYK